MCVQIKSVMYYFMGCFEYKANNIFASVHLADAFILSDSIQICGCKPMTFVSLTQWFSRSERHTEHVLLQVLNVFLRDLRYVVSVRTVLMGVPQVSCLAFGWNLMKHPFRDLNLHYLTSS